MKRITIWKMVLAVALGFPSLMLNSLTTNILAAQDVTITIKKGKNEDSEKADNEHKKAPFAGERPAVDVAILLDTSNSMDGLINQAKTQLWSIVQQFSDAKKNGKTPLLRVAVFEYGNTDLPANEGYIRQVVQLTDDLDKVSEALFALTTHGGDEYCGMVIDEAIKRLDWNGEPNAYKAIFIAGNEPFTQGSVDYQTACKTAIGAGIVVNTIHCGDYQQGISGKWKHGAELTEGEYLNIDQDRVVVHIKCPQDQIILELNKELNKTYLWYGAEAVRSKLGANQEAQDENARSVGGFGGRASTKTSSLYRNVGRDLVDTFEEDADSILDIEAAQLPQPMQEMDAEQRQAHIVAMAKRRAEIKQKMAVATRERVAFIEAEKAKMNIGNDESTLGAAVAGAVQKQLQASGFEVKNKQ
jgi:hypothetical protein